MRRGFTVMGVAWYVRPDSRKGRGRRKTQKYTRDARRRQGRASVIQRLGSTKNGARKRRVFVLRNARVSA